MTNDHLNEVNKVLKWKDELNYTVMCFSGISKAKYNIMHNQLNKLPPQMNPFANLENKKIELMNNLTKEILNLED